MVCQIKFIILYVFVYVPINYYFIMSINTQVRNNHIHGNSNYFLRMPSMETASTTSYEPYQGVHSLQSLNNSPQQNIYHQTANLSNKQSDPKHRTNQHPIAPIIPNKNYQFAKKEILSTNIKLAVGNIDQLISKSQNQLFNISTAQTRENPIGSRKDRWIYLQKFQKDYQKLIADLKTKRQFLSILFSRLVNIQEMCLIQQWVEDINSRYIQELLKQLNFFEWKDNLNKPDSQFFKLVVHAGKQDPEIMKLADQYQNNALTNPVKKVSKVQSSNLSKSQINLFPFSHNLNFRFSQTSLQFSGETKNKDSQCLSGYKIINIPKSFDNSENSPQTKNKYQSFSMKKSRSQYQQNESGSLLQSHNSSNSNKNYIMQYSDAHTFKTSELKRWIQQNANNIAGTQSLVLNDEFEPIQFIPYNLTGSYHPMTQSQSSNLRSRISDMQHSQNRSVKM